MPADTGQHVPEPLNYVDGDWTSSSASGQEVVDPATGETLATVGFSTTDDIDPVSALVTEAIFGPVLGVLPVADVDAGIDLLNGSDYGNAASLFTESGRETRELRRRAEAGDLAVNAGTAAPVALFYLGGRKNSFSSTCTPSPRTPSGSTPTRRSTSNAGRKRGEAV